MSFFIFLLALANAISAAPNVVLPVNSQFPPVARISQSFSFIFAESTFASSGPDLTYSFSEAPGWLHLDSSSRALYGTPGPEDLGSPALKLTATDNTGSTSMVVKLLVSNRIGPSLGNPVSEQLPAFGAFSHPNSLLISPTSPLHVSFSKITFENTDANTSYYASSADNNPLPPWLKFDPESLSFSGTTPDSISSGDFSENFDIHLTASDEVGYSAATASFRIVVETHLFSFSTGLHIINATQGVPFNFSGLQADLLLDGQPLNKTADLAHIVADIPEWMSLNEGSLVLSGIPPVSAVSQNLTVTATSVYYDVANTAVLILLPGVSQTTFFQGSIGTLNATTGSDFDYKIDRSFFTRSGLLISVDLGATASWLSFDPANLKLHGSVPGDLKPEISILNMTASQGMQSQSQVFMIAIQEGNEEGRQDAGGPKNRAVHTGSPSATSGSSKHWLPAAVIVPTAVISGLLLVALLYVRNRRLRRSKHGPRKNPKKLVISRPIMQESSWITVSDDGRARAIGPGEHRESSKPPKIDVVGLSTRDLSIRNSQNQAATATAAERGRTSRHDSWRDFVGHFDRLQPEYNPSPEFRLEGSNMRGGRVRSSSPYSRPESSWSGCLPVGRNSAHEKSRAARFTTRSGLSFNQRLSAFGPASTGGMGHGVRMEDGRSGSGIGDPWGFGIVRPSWRNTTAHSLSTSEHATTTDSSMDTTKTLSSIIQRFPRTPTSHHKRSHAAQKYAIPSIRTSRSPRKQVTIRKVRQSPRGEPMRDISTLAAFHKQRVSTHYKSNPLFSAGPSSRVSSNSLWKKAPRNSTALSTKYPQDYREFEPSITPREESPSSRDLGPRRRFLSRSSSFRPFPHADNTPSPAPRRMAGSPGNSSPLLINLSRFAPACRRHSRSISLTSSQRFGSAIMTDDDDKNSSGYGELFVGEAYDDDGEEIAVDDEEDQEEVEENDSSWRHAGLPNPLGHHSPTAHKFDLRRWRDETLGPRPRTAGKLPERSTAREVESNSSQKKSTTDEQSPSVSPYPIYSGPTTPRKTVGVIGKRPKTVTERDLEQRKSLTGDISGMGSSFPSPSPERTAANPSSRPGGSSAGASRPRASPPPLPSWHPTPKSTPSSPENTLPSRPGISRSGGGGQLSALLTLSEMLSQQQDPTNLESILLTTASPHGELKQSLESDISPLSTAAVEQAEGIGSRRRLKEEEDKEDKGRSLDLGVGGGENTEGASGIAAFL